MVKLNNRDKDVDWILAKYCYYAQCERIWADFSPTTDWKEGGYLIDKYKIDIKYDPVVQSHPEGKWFGGVTLDVDGTPHYFTAWGPTALIAAMRALAKGLEG